jgi:asparagine synthase (glutamine-hydrolysing)
MCGIAGIYNFPPDAPLPQHGLVEVLTRLNEAQAHRGPDDEGVWLSENGQVGFGHRRLAIIDLSAAGHQPMSNEDGSIWLTYNGEIYNFKTLREELQALGHSFRSHTDTETVIHAYEEWGTDSFLRFRGMFAFALWDERQRCLYLVKDRFGIKPLYYYQDAERLAFASEVRALAGSCLFSPEKNPDALIAFLLLGSVPMPMTTLKQVHGLPAGHYLVVENGRTRLVRYYDLWADTESDDRAQDPEALKNLLAETVDLHLISDAPIGVFLSGGIDSSALVALGAMSRKSQLTTLSIIFQEAEFSEQKYQHLIARKYQTDHREFSLSHQYFRDNISQVFAAMDQPTIDGVNSYFVSLMAREAGLKAVLSGTGGDEVFCGYPHFAKARQLSFLPYLWPLFRFTDCFLNHLSGRLRKLSFLGVGGSLGLYLAIRGLFSPQEVAHLTGDTQAHVLEVTRSLDPGTARRHRIDLLSRYEINFYLQNQLLKDMDCMSMAHSVETRVPFLDPELVSVILASPPQCRVKGGIPKVLLTRALNGLLPPELVFRPKMTFTLPFAEWLKDNQELAHPWRNFSPDSVAATWQDYAAGRTHWAHPWALEVAGHLMS